MDWTGGLPSTITGALVYLTVSLSLSIGIIHFIKRQHRAYLINLIPGPKTDPIFGNTLQLNVEPKELFKILTNKFCDSPTSITRAWNGLMPYVIVHKASAVEAILSSQKHIVKSSDYRYLHPWLGTGLLTSTGEKWHSRRKLLTPAFHFKILEDFVGVFNEQSLKFVDKLKPKADGQPFSIFGFITLCTLDVILETAMGRKINAQDNSESEYVKSISRMLSIAQMRQTRPWLQPNLLFKLSSYSKEQDRCLKILHGFSNETIRDRKKEYRDSRRKKGLHKSEEAEDVLGRRKKLAFLDLLLEYSEEKHELSDEDLREEVDTFMFEGHDTTGAAINWTIYLLGSHPEIQEKVAAEMEAIFGESERKATANDIHEMRYLECCIKEALRLFPVVPFIGRELKEEMYIDGFRIPVGTSITIMPYRLHRDPAQFPEPESFIPERFYPENSVKRHPYAYIPFSAGPRNCIGQKFALMEAKVVLSWFVRNFRVESTVKRENLGILGELILRPEDGTVIKLYPRK